MWKGVLTHYEISCTHYKNQAHRWGSRGRIARRPRACRRERRGFAAKLPEELQSAAMMVPTASAEDDIIEQYMDLEDVDEHKARDYLRAAWQAVCELFDRESMDDITAELPRGMVAVLE